MTLKLFDLTGRIALVTGSSQGIGLGIARGLAQAGARVVLNGRDRGRLDAARLTLAEQDLLVDVMAFDVTSKSAVDAAVDSIERDIGPIRILINNAGIQRRGP